MNLQEQISRIKVVMGLFSEQFEKKLEDETLKINYNSDDFNESEVKETVWRAGDTNLRPKSGGIWFAETKEGVEKFAISVRNQKITGKPYKIILKNPKLYERFWGGYLKDVEPTYGSENRGMEREILMTELLSQGYDGIIIDTDTWNDTGDENSVTSKQFIVFDPSQIIPI